MHLSTKDIWNLLRRRTNSKSLPKMKRLSRLTVEVLEDRCTPSATASSVLNGFAFIDGNGNGVFDTGEAAIPGVVVKLTGSTSAPAAANLTDSAARIPLTFNVSAITDSTGAYHFQNVLPGTYQLKAGPAAGVLNSGPVTIGNILVNDQGHAVSRNLGLQGGLDPALVSMRQFLTTTAVADYGYTTTSNGIAETNFRANSKPIEKTALADLQIAKNSPDSIINLAGHFSDPDFTNSQVTFNITNGTTQVKLKVDLFDKKAPQTVANFFDYIASGAYDNSIFHRLAASFVLQGGALKLANSAGTNLDLVDLHNLKVPNEFGTSNTFGTLAMAQSGNDPNSATNQFFFNLVNNASSLDAQKFAVFGQLADAASRTALTSLGTTPNFDESTTTFAVNHGTALLNSVPIKKAGYTNNDAEFPTNLVAADYLVINSVSVDKRDEFLKYEIVSNTNPDLVTATLDPNSNELLKLQYATDEAGAATITIRATDRFGATLDVSFDVTVANTAPTASVTLTPDAPAPTATLTATATASDANGDTPITFTYNWSVNGGAPVKTTTGTTSTTDTLDLSAPEVGALNPGDTITVTVTPNDGTDNGANASANVTINQPPAFSGDTVLSPTSPSLTGSTTVTVAATDPDEDPVTFTYVWEVNGTVVRSVTKTAVSDTLNLDNLRDLSNNPVPTQAGDQIVVTITPSDGKTTGETTTAATTINQPPVLAAELTPAGPNSNDLMTATVTSSSDPDLDALNYTYTWYARGAPVHVTQSTTSTTDVFDLSTVPNLVAGDLVEVFVVPNDGKIDGAGVLLGQTVSNTAPEATSVSIAPDNALAVTLLAATPVGSDFDMDPVTFTYQWLKNDVLIVDATSDTLILADVPGGVNVDDTFAVIVTPNDGATNGAEFISPAVTVATIDPTITLV
ncbi:MAG: peptidylprolyl isomerase [Planctomycetes bacterium]|nr:peptidylprolyl isomerase [Planctomycetota bacterium]